MSPDGTKRREASGEITNMDIKTAIEHSQTENRIVTLDWTAEAQAELVVECDDSVDMSNVVEYWGENDDGTWRIHLER